MQDELATFEEEVVDAKLSDLVVHVSDMISKAETALEAKIQTVFDRIIQEKKD